MSITEEILIRIGQVQQMANQLVLIVGPRGSGKTLALRAVAEQAGYPYLGVGLALSEDLLDVPPTERPFRVSPALDKLVDKHGPVVLLDNLEILFEPTLQLNPLSLLQTLSRSRTVVAAWNGALTGSTLTHAEPGHREYRTYPRGQLVVVALGIVSGAEDNR